MPADWTERFWFCHRLASRFKYETEELADFYIHRRLAALLVALMGAMDMPWFFTPNRITFVSLFFGLVSAYFAYIATDDMSMFFWAGVCEVLSITFDCCDGQLARMYQNGSLVGRVLDGLVDMTVALSHGFTWTYILVYKYEYLNPVVGFVILAVSIVTFQQQAMIYDRIKNLYVLKTAPKKEDATVGLEEGVILQREMDAAWASNSYISYLLLLWYQQQYLAVQNAVSKKSVESHLKEKDALSPEEYRKQWKSTMRLVSWCGTGTHSFLFYALLFAVYFFQDPRALIAWYFINNVIISYCWYVSWSRVEFM